MIDMFSVNLDLLSISPILVNRINENKNESILIVIAFVYCFPLNEYYNANKL